MNNKGFTLIELLGVIVVLAIISGLAVLSINGVIETGKKSVYKSYEDSFKDAVINYFTDDSKQIPKINNEKKIYLEDMIASNYLDDINDPNGGDCNNKENNSYVLVKRNGDISFNYNLEYKVCLICVTTSGSFTYKSDGC